MKNVIFQIIAIGAVILVSAVASACRDGDCANYNWTQAGTCAEFGGRYGDIFVQYAPYAKCEKQRGYFFAWTGNGGCAEFTPRRSTFVRYVARDYCRKYAGQIRHTPIQGSLLF